MKGKEIAERYNVNAVQFRKFVDVYNVPHTNTFSDVVIDDDCVDVYVFVYKSNDYSLLKKPIPEIRRIMQQTNEERRKQTEIERARLDAKRKAEEAEKLHKKQAMAEMLITSGFNFDGYRIVKYSGYISGDDAISVPRGFDLLLGIGTGDTKSDLMSSLAKIRRNALRELKEAAYDLGCNAVIGVDFDYITLDPQTANLSGGTTYQPYVFGVTANGNAVIIEKIED